MNNDLIRKELELEELKKNLLLAVIFFDGENRNEINELRKKKKEVEETIEKLKK